jgi:CheY-like chemotaxis protein
MPSLLVVDDDPNIRALFSRALKSLGDVDVAASGADALRMLGQKRYDVVMLDLHMPVVDGFFVLNTLATRPGPNTSTPVFVVSADMTERARIDALRKKALFFLTKPVNIGMLTSLVDGALKNAQARSARPARPGSLPDIDLSKPPGKKDP